MHALTAQGITKTYGGVTALAGADLTLRPGSVHALLGENGAGKSTLIKVITGAVAPDSGTLRLAGADVAFASTAQAAANGVAVVSQELNLFPDLDVLANLYPMREPRRGALVDRAVMQARATPVLEQLGLDVDPRAKLGSLSLAQRQLVEIAKALIVEPRVLILDEPTSALDKDSSGRLLDVLRVLRDRQVAVVFVSHILEEVMNLCDEITVLREGRTVLDARPRAELDIGDVVHAMLGQDLPTPVRTTGTPSAAKLELRRVSVPDRLTEVDLTCSGGEIVGLAGLAGSGHTSALEVVAGIRRPTAGSVSLPGGGTPRSFRSAIAAGVALVSGDRRRVGLMLDKPVWENIAQVKPVAMAGAPLLRTGALRDSARELAQRVRVQPPTVDTRAGLLSGGNQQKVVLAKWLAADPSVLLLDDPTRGVDLGARNEIHALLRSVAEQGKVVVMCSTDLDELVSACDRVVVFHKGRVCAELTGDRIDQHTILRTMNTGQL
ncbi:sugar ABC transporter ATP-binding protein [Saccharothrix algeriensis]|uniref:ABC-type sugar transport system ATPase subunit n=1 Tax=Saccharothrix algeriensis TaxID=173560 RepID=A0A8T8HWA6_9PSEU|nr:sugar ABC transporter ATP-binding protein [Saccharothrix algeriensis]MBM7814325.1 ABC-type sugar transport system ATPase subunit [Saccharothrix algeriensis]QTR02659.1 sugar ABC transporter ATP-binding protein [Saccharothrix algeriensis]